MKVEYYSDNGSIGVYEMPEIKANIALQMAKKRATEKLRYAIEHENPVLSKKIYVVYAIEDSELLRIHNEGILMSQKEYEYHTFNKKFRYYMVTRY